MSAVARRDGDSGDYSDSQDIERNSTNDGPLESDYDSAASDSEHSDQDPDSQETERRVDDDEDRSNPQYIPKKGTFYEHDDRTAASGDDTTTIASETASEQTEGASPGAERRRAPRKSEVIDRWSHDKYNENEQAPKSRDELVAIYGYDIRNEDAPPHARRNRRYGRGPNKYTRTWEDEDAYRRQAQAQAPRKPPNPEDFPELDAANKLSSRRTRGPRPRSKSQPTSNESLSNGTSLRRNASTKAKPERKAERKPPSQPAKNNVKPPPKEKMPPIENLTITTSVVNNNQSQPQRKVNATVAQQRPVPTEQGKKKPTQPVQPVTVSKSLPSPQPRAPAPAPPAPPAATESRGGSKRYSSLRQRPLADAYTPQPQQQQQQQQQQQTQQQQQPQHRYHPAEYPGAAPAQLHPQQLLHQVHRNANQPPHGPSPPHQNIPQNMPQTIPQNMPQNIPQNIPQNMPQNMPQNIPQNIPQTQHSQQVRLGIVEQQQLLPHAHHSLHSLPPQPHAMAAAPIQQAQGYAPPAMMPAQYMQQSANNAVFGAAPLFAQPPQPYPHQLYQHHNYSLQATQAGGVTYYSPAEQEPPAPAPRPQRRPTAAIPIVRPDRPANSSEKDNIDRIVENMFVRKPWPATQQNSDGSKDKTLETRNSQEPPSKESSQPNSLTSSSISTDSKPSEKEREHTEPEAREDDKKAESKEEVLNQDSIATDA